MPYEFQFETIPIGYAETCALAEDEHVTIRAMGVATSADGELLSTWLSGIPTDILKKVAKTGTSIDPSAVSNLLAIIRPDKSALAYVNDLQFIASIRLSPERILERVEVGQAIYENDVDDIIEVCLEGIELPPDAGVVLFCSDGWRRGLFFDLVPVLPEGVPRAYSISNVLGGIFSQVRFQHVFGLTHDDWDSLFQSKWFPFAGLQKETVKLLVSAMRCRRDPDELLPRIRTELAGRLPTLAAVWRKNSVFADHLPFIDRAIERFVAEDYISCVSILFPRIEGLLRSNHVSVGSGDKPEQKHLCVSAIAGLAQSAKLNVGST